MLSFCDNWGRLMREGHMDLNLATLSGIYMYNIHVCSGVSILFLPHVIIEYVQSGMCKRYIGLT